MSTKVVTKKVRFSFCHVWQPQEGDDGRKTYGVCVMIPKSDKETVAKIKAAIEEAKQEGKTSKWGGKIPPNCKTPLRDGDTERDLDINPEFEGHWFLNANSLRQPGIIDADKEDILDTTEFYSGCYGRASLNFYAYDSKGSKGVAAGLNNLQKLSDGPALGGGASRAEDDFNDDFEDEDDDLLD
ncbi:DUF2815 family protein [Paenibacillus sp. TAB 01]|uniref:DUF2815 family protein n=1 Tax=Paenibacillus sp. TAB 01 TaxID=3368988 RepID=UPI003751953E